MRLVFGIKLGAVALAGIVEDHRHVGRGVVALQIFGELEDHVAEAGHTADRQTVRLARQLRQGMKSAENEGRAVDEQQMHGDSRRPVRGDHKASGWERRQVESWGVVVRGKALTRPPLRSATLSRMRARGTIGTCPSTPLPRAGEGGA